MKLLKLLANLGYGSRKQVMAMFRDGALMIVANRHLPYEQVLGAEFANVSVLGEGKGFKVILAKRE